MKIAVFTEGGKGIGFGHIARCIALCDALKELGCKPTFFVNGDDSVEDLLRGESHRTANWMTREGGMGNEDLGDCGVIIDSYLAGPEIYDEISGHARASLFIDDFNRMDYPEGIVLNSSVGAEYTGFAGRDPADCLLGPKYSLLRREFWDVPRKEIKEDAECIFITMGGNDFRGLMPSMLDMLAEKYRNMEKIAVIGRGFKNTDKIEMAGDEKTELVYFPDAWAMRDLMSGADIAVSAGGQTLYELARMGVPSVAVSIADNQLANSAEWSRKGFADYAGSWDDIDILKKVERGVGSLLSFEDRKRRSEIGSNSVDGLGARRVAAIFGERLSR